MVGRTCLSSMDRVTFDISCIDASDREISALNALNTKNRILKHISAWLLVEKCNPMNTVL